jgi:hypothetical protein
MTNDATTNVGFKGPITSAQLPTMLTKGVKYAVGSAGALKVTAGVGTRVLSVAAGSAWGDGVESTWDTPTSLTGTAVASSGYRWDTVYIKRTWQPLSSPTGKAEIRLQAGSASKTISGRATSAGTGASDQPIALVRFDYNSNVVTEIVDLRVWGDNGGLYANSVEVTQYINEPGASVRIGAVQYDRVVDPSSGAVSWDATHLRNLGAVILEAAQPIARLAPTGVNGTGMQFSVNNTTNSIIAQKPGSGGPVTTFQVDEGGDIIDGNLPYDSLYGETSDTTFGSNGSGFDMEFGTIYRRGDLREMFLETRAGSLKVVNSAGQVSDMDLFTIDAADRPRRTVPLTIMYRGIYRPNKSDTVASTELGALVGGAGYISAGGVIRFISGLPDHDVLSFPTTGATAHTPTFYIHAMWGV